MKGYKLQFKHSIKTTEEEYAAVPGMVKAKPSEEAPEASAEGEA